MSMPEAAHRIVLLPETKPTASHEPVAKVRRYRLARLRLAENRAPRDARFSHLTRTFD